MRSFSSRKEFRDWNEAMFKKFGNAKAYRNPNPFIAWIENERARQIVAEVASEKRVLDIGCGEGLITERIGVDRAVGLDLSKEALKEARRRLPRAKLVLGDAQNLPFKDNSFDAAVCSEVIEHNPEPGKILKEAARVTKPNGKIVVTIPDERNIEMVKAAAKSIGLFNFLLPTVPEKMEWHLYSFSLEMLRRITPKDLRIERVVSIPFFYPIRRVLVFRVSSAKPLAR
jgi:demethylmenaquinone methyltransferase/2-methoxy-6-polyprenyl-1,4-benzoquinol methylase